MKTLSKVFRYILKHWRWLIVVLCVVVFVIFPTKPVGPLLSGMAAVGFVWSAYGAWKYYLSK